MPKYIVNDLRGMSLQANSIYERSTMVNQKLGNVFWTICPALWLVDLGPVCSRPRVIGSNCRVFLGIHSSTRMRLFSQKRQSRSRPLRRC